MREPITTNLLPFPLLIKAALRRQLPPFLGYWCDYDISPTFNYSAHVIKIIRVIFLGRECSPLRIISILVNRRLARRSYLMQNPGLTTSWCHNRLCRYVINVSRTQSCDNCTDSYTQRKDKEGRAQCVMTFPYRLSNTQIPLALCCVMALNHTERRDMIRGRPLNVCDPTASSTFS